MSRQTDYQARKLAAGTCVQCGARPINKAASRRYCLRCLTRHRILQRYRRAEQPAGYGDEYHNWLEAFNRILPPTNPISLTKIPEEKNR